MVYVLILYKMDDSVNLNMTNLRNIYISSNSSDSNSDSEVQTYIYKKKNLIYIKQEIKNNGNKNVVKYVSSIRVEFN